MGVRARLEVDVERAASRSVGCGREGFIFRVRLARLAMVSLANELAGSVEDQGAHHRVRARPVIGPARQLDGTRCPVQVEALGGFCGSQSWQYTRAEIVINQQPNQVYEILQPAFSRWIRICISDDHSSGTEE